MVLFAAFRLLSAKCVVRPSQVVSNTEHSTSLTLHLVLIDTAGDKNYTYYHSQEIIRVVKFSDACVCVPCVFSATVELLLITIVVLCVVKLFNYVCILLHAET